MEYSIKSLFSAILIAFSIPAHGIVLDPITIEKNALKIEKRLKQERYLMYGLTTIAVVHEVYQWAPLLKFLLTSRSSVAVEKCEEIGFFQGIKEGARQAFYTKEGWNSLFQSAFSMSLGITGIVTISQMGEKFIHPDTLRWYASAHAPYQETIKLMKKSINNIQDPFIDSKQREINNEMLSLLYDRLVQQATLISSYMVYKVKHFNVAERAVGERAKTSMLKVHHIWLHNIQEQLNHADRNYTTLENLFVMYENAITAQLNHFAMVEGETRRERLAVEKQMKQRSIVLN